MDILGISDEQLLFDDGCSIFHATVVYTWSVDNPLSPQLLEVSRQMLLPNKITATAETQEGLPVCPCCTMVRNRGESKTGATRRALVVDRRCKSERMAAVEGTHSLSREPQQCRA